MNGAVNGKKKFRFGQRTSNHRKEKHRREDVAIKSAKATWWIYFVIAVVILALGGYLDLLSEFEKHVALARLYSIFSPVLMTLGSVIITSAVGTFLLKRTGLIEVIKGQISEIMVDSGFIKLLGEEELVRFKKTINEIIYSPEISNNEHSLLNTVDATIEPILESYYFKRFDLNIDCEIKDDCIEKILTRKITVKRASNKNVKISLKDFFCVAFDEIINEDIPSAKLIEFKVNDNSFGDKIVLNEVTSDIMQCCCKQYELKVKDKKDYKEIDNYLTLTEGEVRVKVVTKTKTSLDDVLIVHKLPAACKEYKVRFNYDKEKYTIIGAPFGFMDDHIKGKYVMDDISGNAKEIEFYDWLLPGDGVAFAINKI